MLKVRNWIGVVSTPVLLASMGCAIGPKSFLARSRDLPPDRLMTMARMFERQGHLVQAKTAYMQILATQPNFPNARESLETIIAAEIRRGGGVTSPQNNASPMELMKSPQQLAAAQPAPSAVPMMRETNSSQQVSAVSTDEPKNLSISSAANSIVPEPVATHDQPSTDIVEVISNESNGSSDSVTSTAAIAPDSPGTASVTTTVTEVAVEFFAPVVIDEVAVVGSLEQFLGPFDVEMVKSLRANREEYQPELTRLAVNRTADINLRTRAIFLLGAIGAEAQESVPTLCHEMLDCDDQQLSVDLAEAILKIHSEDIEAINVLIGFLNGSDRNIKHTAAFALRNAVSPKTTFIIGALADSLKTDDVKLRRMIFLILAEFGPAAERVIPELEEALESPDPATREVAKASLACIAPDRKSAQNHSTSMRLRWAIGLNQ